MKLYIGNISYKATEDELRDFIEQAGHPVSECKIMTDRETGKTRGFGFVLLSDPHSNPRAIGNLHGASFMGRELTVNEARPKQQTGYRGW